MPRKSAVMRSGPASVSKTPTIRCICHFCKPIDTESSPLLFSNDDTTPVSCWGRKLVGRLPGSFMLLYWKGSILPPCSCSHVLHGTIHYLNCGYPLNGLLTFDYVTGFPTVISRQRSHRFHRLPTRDYFLLLQDYVQLLFDTGSEGVVTLAKKSVASLKYERLEPGSWRGASFILPVFLLLMLLKVYGGL